MAPAPADFERQLAAVLAIERAIAGLAPLDEEGLLVNAVVDYVEGDPRVQRVGQICEKFALTERSLQRLAAEGSVELAGVAADLGYTDQAHFGRDWRRVTGVTPGEYAAQRHPS
jgi:hypothetical protein